MATHFDVIVSCNGGNMSAQRFVSYHSASRCFTMYVGDFGIDSVAIVNTDGLELAKWVNITPPDADANILIIA
jgi:hypothetical protein